MPHSLLFLPDISGFTEFVQTTEVEHSHHVIAELLETLIEANTHQLKLAEIEGDALFFYKENEILAKDELLAQMETMFTAFYDHLRLLEKNRICPCMACSTAAKLQLKIIAHSGELQYITVQGNRKPYGPQVIQAHRLMKNSVKSDNYVLISQALADGAGLGSDYSSDLFQFESASDTYDGRPVGYLYSKIDPAKLPLNPLPEPKLIELNREPDFILERSFKLPSDQLFELLSNFKYRSHWVKGVDRFEYKNEEVNRLGTEHACVINQKHLNFTTVTIKVEEHQLVYGEHTIDAKPIDNLYQFSVITPMDDNSSKLILEVHILANSWWKQLFLDIFVKPSFKKTIEESLVNLTTYINTASPSVIY